MIRNSALAVGAALLSAAVYAMGSTLAGTTPDAIRAFAGMIVLGYPFIAALIIGGVAYVLVVDLTGLRSRNNWRFWALLASPIAGLPYVVLLGAWVGVSALGLVWPAIFAIMLGSIVRVR